MTSRYLALVFACLLLAGVAHAAGAVTLLDPGAVMSLDRWSEKVFHGQTRYTAKTLDGRSALCGESDGAASALLHKAVVKLDETPYLRWRWRVERALAPGETWPNPYAGKRAMMWVLRSAGDELHAWRDEMIDVRAAYRQAFGFEPGTIEAVGLMVDSDNTGLQATGCFSDIRFTRE